MKELRLQAIIIEETALRFSKFYQKKLGGLIKWIISHTKPIFGDACKQTIKFHLIPGYAQTSLIVRNPYTLQKCHGSKQFQMMRFSYPFLFKENGRSIKLHFSITGNAENKTEHSSLSDWKLPLSDSSKYLTENQDQRPQFC